ncbi:hypothetical protein OOZ15_18410 [Galbibacter sp. EGI 63066]|uniref:hypothetical protein n=1 Tax=Galbibacter sp. EGI 63066 TaxID=2993559 RepID=UPI0022488AA7|nr:hypothetical protein [Galbibacter sp. EGI 63066]MCX2681931.1 hypothetical protein [Galbibacter sp. EGI 63066]
MKKNSKLSTLSIFLFLLVSCSSDDDSYNEESQKSNENSPVEELTPVEEALTENLFKDILNGFSITNIIKSSDKNKPPSTTTPSSISKQLLRPSDTDCRHEITNTIENKDFIFSNPITAEDIDNYLNAEIVSTTEYSVKYFSKDKAPATDCETEELEGPVPNHDDVDALLRPTFYHYDHIFDYLGEHHFVNEFYIESSEQTVPSGTSTPSSWLVKKGPIEKRIDRYHQVHVSTKAEHSRVEDLELGGYVRSELGYKFEFLEGSKKYHKVTYTIMNELSNPTPGDTQIDMIDRYVVRFFVRFSDNTGRVDGVFRIPFEFDITIDLDEVVEKLKDEEGQNSYTKTVPLYLKGTDEKRAIGTVKYVMDVEEIWEVNITANPLLISDSELDYILAHYN